MRGKIYFTNCTLCIGGLPGIIWGLISSVGMDGMERWIVIRGQQSSKNTFGAKKKRKIFVLFSGNAGSDSEWAGA